MLKSLAADEYLAAVEADQAQAVAYGIQAVPTFVIDSKYGISGAQAPETFVERIPEGHRRENRIAGYQSETLKSLRKTPWMSSPASPRITGS